MKMELNNSVVQSDAADKLMREKLNEMLHDMQVGKKVTVDKDYQIIRMSDGAPYTMDMLLKDLSESVR
jgi:hypothetical protein